MLKNYSKKYRLQFKVSVFTKFICFFLFLSTFHIVAHQLQEKSINLSQTKNLVSVITKNTSNADLQDIINIFKKNNVKVVFSKVRRNTNHEIIQIKVMVSYGKDKLEYSTKNNEVINDFTIEGQFEEGKIVDVYFGVPKNETSELRMNEMLLMNDSKDIIAYQNVRDEQVYNTTKNNEIIFVSTKNQSNNNKIIILQKEDLENTDTKSGIEIVTNLLKNEKLDLETARLRLNQKDIKLNELNQINNREEIVIILSNENKANDETSNIQKKGLIEIFQNQDTSNQSIMDEEVKEAITMFKEARKELVTSEKRTFKMVMKAMHDRTVDQQTNDQTTTQKIAIEQEKMKTTVSENVPLNQPKVTFENGKKVITHQVYNKSGIIIKNTTTNSELSAYKNYLKEEGILFEYKNLTRNAYGMITGIEIEISSGNKKASSTWETSENNRGVPDIFVGRINGELSVITSE